MVEGAMELWDEEKPEIGRTGSAEKVLESAVEGRHGNQFFSNSYT
jgi:hypothetical protein